MKAEMPAEAVSGSSGQADLSNFSFGNARSSVVSRLRK
jgi:hypothetical protein